MIYFSLCRFGLRLRFLQRKTIQSIADQIADLAREIKNFSMLFDLDYKLSGLSTAPYLA